jgi:hypothetical protein
MHKDEDKQVSDDHFLLGQILEDGGITVKQLCLYSGRSAACVYRYLSGEATIPSLIWRVLFERTGDHRILTLVAGDQRVLAIVPKDCGDLKLSLDTVVAMRKQQIAIESEILDVLSSPDKDRREAVNKFKMDFPRMVGMQAKLYGMIVGGKER